MNLGINYRSEFSFSSKPSYGLQRLKIVAKDTGRQLVKSWNVEVEGGSEELSYFDHHGNKCKLIIINHDIKKLLILVDGLVSTTDTSGISGDQNGPCKLWMYKKETPLTKPGNGIKKFCRQFIKMQLDDIELCHKLAQGLKETISYRKGSTSVDTTAEQAFNMRAGVCQDFSHAFLAATRYFGLSSRYVSGFMHDNSLASHEATHAWVEVFIENLGWVGFDLANNIVIDERYVSLAYGFDFNDAQPIYGLAAVTADSKSKQYLNINHLKGSNQ